MAGPPNFTPVSGEWVSGFDVPVAAAAPPPKPAEPAAPKPLVVVLPFIDREREQVLRLLDWISQLNSGKPLSRTLYLVPFKGLKIDDVLAKARAAFSDVQVITDSEGASSDWKKGDKVRDAAGPNSLFRQAAWFFYLHKELGPWLWLEPDCVPLLAGWDEAIETAYRSSGKPFLGARMKFAAGDYLNGAAVYPREAVARAPALVTRAMWTQFPELEIAFDVAGGAEVLRQATLTDLIQLEYRNGAEPQGGAVLFHGDRDGELLQKLLSGSTESRRAATLGLTAAKRNGASGVDENTSPESDPSRSSARPAQKSPKKKQVGAVVARRAHTAEVEGSIPSPATPAVNGNGHFETVGDRVRKFCDEIFLFIDGHANRKTRLCKEIRKRRLLPLR